MVGHGKRLLEIAQLAKCYKNMKYWLISGILSTWAATSSIFLNTALAFQLPLTDYGQWVRWTALLPLLSGLLAPLVLYCSRVGSNSYCSVDEATSFLMNVAIAIGILVIFLMLIGLFLGPMLSLTSGILIWLSNLLRICIDGVLLSPKIIKLGLYEKIAKALIPTTSLLAVLLISPRDFSRAGFAIAAGITIAGSIILLWLRKKSERKCLHLSRIGRLYKKEFPSAYLSFVSSGIFSIPLFLFSKFHNESMAGILGIVITVLSGASAFSSIFLSKPIYSVADFLQKGGNFKEIKLFPFISTSIASSFGCFILISFFLRYKGIADPFVYGLVASLLVLIEVAQSFITVVFMRLGDRKIILSATGSAFVNIPLSILVANPVYLILGFTITQCIFFLVPGIVRLKNQTWFTG